MRTYPRKFRIPVSFFLNHGYADLDRSDDFSDLDEDELPHRYSINLLRRLLQGARLDGQRILEVGSGRGGNCSYLAKHHRPRGAYAMDYSAGNVDFCRRNHKQERLYFLQGDAQSLPFEDELFDCVVNIESSHCYPDVARFFSEVRRVLKPGGAFYYADCIGAATLEEHEKRLGESGLRLLSSEDMTANAARAIELNQDTLASILNGAIDPKLRNRKFIEDLLHGINFTAYGGYLQRRWIYKIWRLAKGE